MAELETGGQKLRSACDTKQLPGERNCRKLSTEAERDAWKQAKRKADKWAPERTTARGSRDEGKGKRRG